MNQPFIPAGNPLPRVELLKVAEFTQADLDRALATANRKLKPYLDAEPYGGQSQQPSSG